MKKSMSILMVGSAASDTMEEWAQKLTEESGVKVDWHYVGGRAHVYCETEKLADHDHVVALIHRLGVPVYRDVVEDSFPSYAWLTPEGRILDQLGAYLPGDDFCVSPAEQILNFMDRRRAASEGELKDPFSSSQED